MAPTPSHGGPSRAGEIAEVIFGIFSSHRRWKEHDGQYFGAAEAEGRQGLLGRALLERRASASQSRRPLTTDPRPNSVGSGPPSNGIRVRAGAAANEAH